MVGRIALIPTAIRIKYRFNQIEIVKIKGSIYKIQTVSLYKYMSG